MIIWIKLVLETRSVCNEEINSIWLCTGVCVFRPPSDLCMCVSSPMEDGLPQWKQSLCKNLFQYALGVLPPLCGHKYSLFYMYIWAHTGSQSRHVSDKHHKLTHPLRWAKNKLSLNTHIKFLSTPTYSNTPQHQSQKWNWNIFISEYIQNARPMATAVTLCTSVL